MSYRHMNYEPTEFRLTPQTNCTYVISSLFPSADLGVPSGGTSLPAQSPRAGNTRGQQLCSVFLANARDEKLLEIGEN